VIYQGTRKPAGWRDSHLSLRQTLCAISGECDGVPQGAAVQHFDDGTLSQMVSPELMQHFNELMYELVHL